jgi:hypothetical protein
MFSDAPPASPLPPWDVSRFPNFARALGVDVVGVSELPPREFHRRYVLPHRPCLIKGALGHWPAMQRWKEQTYLADKIGHVKFVARTTPKPEPVEAYGPAGVTAEQAERALVRFQSTNALPPAPFAALLPRLFAGDDEVFFAEGNLAEAIAADAPRSFPFIEALPKPRFVFPPAGTMFYKNSYSNWHLHPGTEAVMCQVVGTKDVLLLPPDKASWDALVTVHLAQGGRLYGVDPARFPAYAALVPYHVVVEPGDGLFIPVDWWHAAQARPREFGITVPVWWHSGLLDLRNQPMRRCVVGLWRRKKAMAALVAAAALVSTARQVLATR